MNPARGGSRSGSDHLPLLFGKHDRFCVWCGGLIPRQVQQETVRCPNEGCKRFVPLRGGTWVQSNFTGMGRCPQCDSFVHKTFFYCQMCKNPNEEGIARRNLANERSLSVERESNKRLKLEVEQLKMERDRDRQMDVEVAQAAVIIEQEHLDNNPVVAVNVEVPLGDVDNEGFNLGEDALLDEDADL